MNGYDTDGDGENNFYTVNGRTFYYARYPIRVRRGELVRVYLANLTEFDLINSFHLHADFFRYQPTGTGDHWEYTDTVMQCQGQRGVLEIRFAHTGTFMFHAHQSEFTELGLDGLLPGGGLVQVGTAGGDLGWRLWALVPVVLLALAVTVVVSPGRPGRRPRRRRALRRPTSSTSGASSSAPGEIRILVRNPQRDDLTIASVTVDDAIVPFTLDGPATLGRLRSSTVVVAYDWVPERAARGRGHELDGDPDDARDRRRRCSTPQPGPRGFLGYGLIGLLVGVVPVAPRPPLAAVPPAREPVLDRRVHGAHRRPADVPRGRGALRGARAAGRASPGARRPGARPPRARRQRSRDDVPRRMALARPRSASAASRSPRWSRSGSASTTSERASRSGPRSRPESSSSVPSS